VCYTAFDIVEEGNVPVLMSLLQMRNLCFTLEMSPSAVYLTTPAFGKRFELDLSTSRHLVLDRGTLGRPAIASGRVLWKDGDYSTPSFATETSYFVHPLEWIDDSVSSALVKYDERLDFNATSAPAEFVLAAQRLSKKTKIEAAPKAKPKPPCPGCKNPHRKHTCEQGRGNPGAADKKKATKKRASLDGTPTSAFSEPLKQYKSRELWRCQFC
jgi:hypothetical protein